ncbi:MAG: N-acetyltransferase family protein [Pseudomonadota bacterium]
MTTIFRQIHDPNDPVCADIAALWTHYIDTSVVTFNPKPKTRDAISEAIREKRIAGDPVFAAYRDDTFIGFGTYGPFRTGEGYKFSKEHTIMLDAASTGSGIGRQLIHRLEEHACTNNVQSLWAGVTGTNQAAIDFHKTMGFQHIVTIPEIGWKFDRWHDLVLMRKRLR